MLANIMGPDGLIILVVLVIVLLFGGSKLPKLARSLGGASHEFKSASEEFKKAAEAGHAELNSHEFPKSTVTVEVPVESEAHPSTPH